jgi:hypothetical protein
MPRLRIPCSCFATIVLALAGCIGTSDIAIEVQGEIVDDSLRYYNVCTLSLYRGDSGDLIVSRTVTGGEISEFFTVRNIRKGISFGVDCEGTGDRYKSAPFRSTELNPANLGTIELAGR